MKPRAMQAKSHQLPKLSNGRRGNAGKLITIIAMLIVIGFLVWNLH